MKKKYKIIRHELMGKIVVATDCYVRNELVCAAKCVGIAPDRDNYSLQVSDRKHVYLDEPGQLFSHSCEPNMYILDNDFGGYDFHAARDIEPGEVLAFHYGMSEAESVSVPVCHCGANNCAGKSIGFKEASFHLQTYLYDLGTATYLRKWYEKRAENTEE